MGKNQHVVPIDGRWGIKGEGNSKYTEIFDTQKEAIEIARKISKNQQSVFTTDYYSIFYR